MGLSILLFVIGLPGVVVAGWVLLPRIVAASGKDPTVPMRRIVIASTVQGAVILGLAIWAGSSFAPRVGLVAPWLSELADGVWLRDVYPPLLLVPALVGGLIGGLLLAGFDRFAPEGIASVQRKFAPPMSVRLLYGGITEEILIRWGLMSVCMWLFVELFQGGEGAPRSPAVAAAIAVSAVIFGIAHLPATAALAGSLDRAMVSYVVTGNAIFGVMAGYIFWRWGLEAAIGTHVLTHAVAYLFERKRERSAPLPAVVDGGVE